MSSSSSPALSQRTAYIIVFACMLLQAVPFGIAQNIPPLFIKPLIKDFHFTLQSVGYIFTVGAVAASLFAPFIGKLYKTSTVKWLMLVGLLLSALGVVLNSLADALWMFLVTSAMTQIGTITFSGLGIPFLIGSWFESKEKAKALGVAFAGGSVGNFFLQPLVENLLSHHSLHRVYFLMGLSSLVIGAVIIIFFIHAKHPTTAQAPSASEAAPRPSAAVQKGAPFAQVRKDKAFWGMSLFYALIGLSVAALSVQYADYFSHLHIDPRTIGLVGSVFAVSCLAGNLLGGVLFAHLGPKKAMGIAGLFQILALLALLAGLISPTWAVAAAFAWAAIYGLNVFSYTSAPALIIQGLFGMKESSVILGVFSVFFAIGFAFGNILFGFLVDVFGYGVGWGSVLVYTVIGFAGLLGSIQKLLAKHYTEEA